MKNREPWGLRNPLALWSFSLAVFSVVGSLRTVPVLYNILKEKGWDHAVCGDTRLDWIPHNSCSVWISLFVLSKVPELVDTIFIVLRKRKLIFLHWYHHCTVLFFAWHTWATLSLQGLFYAAMNFTIHSMMYTFYGLTAIGYRPKLFAQAITGLQIVQMIGGTVINVYAFWKILSLEPERLSIGRMIEESMQINIDESKAFDDAEYCKPNAFNIVLGVTIYFSYLALFVSFFQRSYSSKSKIKRV